MRFLKSLAGGVGIMAVATLIGVAQNAARSRPLKLITRVAAVHQQGTAPQGADSTSGTPQPARGAGEEAAVSGPITSDEYARGEIAKEHVKSLLASGAVNCLDARSPSEFAEGHLPGAINIPYEQFVDYYDQIVDTVPLDGDVIVYCRSVDCDLSDHLAQELRLMGYEKVLLYKGGWLEWTEAGYPVEDGGGTE